MFQTNAVSYYRPRGSSKIGAKRYRIEVHILVDLPKFYKIIMTSRWSHSASAVRGKPKKGPWTFEEDIRLLRYIRLHGDGRWSALARAAGLQRCGKSCRLRWVNYLRPDLKRVKITEEEERVIIDLHARWGNRWSLIAERLPGRTDNEIKNYWRSHLKKKLQRSENDYNLNVSQRYCSSSTADFSNILGQATTPQSKQSVYSTVATSSSSSSSSGDGTHPRNYPDEMKMKLDIPSAASSISQEFMTNTSVDINSIPSEEALKIKGLHNIDEKGHAIQLSSTSYTSCNDPEVNCVQNDRVTGGVDASLYSFPSFERDTLSAMLSQFYSGIPLELDNIAAGGLQVSTANSGNVAGINPLSDHHVAYEMDSCQDLGSDMILWNMSPIPSTQSELLQLPFASPNSANAHEQ